MICRSAVGYLISGILIFFTPSQVLAKDNHHHALEQARVARNALRHQLETLHKAEHELHTKQEQIDQQLKTVKLQIVQVEKALRGVESTLH